MNHYAYRIYRNTTNNPVIGGTVSADSIEQAVQKAISWNGVKVVHETHNELTYHYFMLDDSKVGILVYANAEDY